MKLKTGDNVVIIAGKDKDKKGKIIKVLPAKNKVVVEGLNMTKRHQRPRKSGEKGTMINMAMPAWAQARAMHRLKCSSPLPIAMAGTMAATCLR